MTYSRCSADNQTAKDRSTPPSRPHLRIKRHLPVREPRLELKTNSLDPHIIRVVSIPVLRLPAVGPPPVQALRSLAPVVVVNVY
jgi:hypothetical protein